MKAKINCGCNKCCEHTKYGALSPHRLTITRSRDGKFTARGHANINEVIDGVQSWEHIQLAYSDYMTWRLEIIQ